MPFRPGQYLEWTLGHQKADSRGNRRYFTLASSPTENEIIMGVKFYNPASSFKKALLSLSAGDEIVASQLAGDFVLPKNKNQKLVFLAGGIGVTPFRSMTKYLLDKNEKRDVVFFYSNKTIQDLLYSDIFSVAEKDFGMKMVYTLAELDKIPSDWPGERGFIDEKMIRNNVPDFMERMFYISGPRVMVVAFEKILAKLGIPKNQIKTDFFPGFA